MDILTIFTKSERLPLNNSADRTLPEEEFSDYVSRAADEARYAEDRKSQVRTTSESRAAGRREGPDSNDDTQEAEPESLAREAPEQSRLEEEPAPEQDRVKASDSEDSTKDHGKEHSADENGFGEGEKTADTETGANSKVETDAQQGTTTQAVVEAAISPATSLSPDIVSSAAARVADTVAARPNQTTTPTQNPTVEPILATNAAQTAAAGQGSTNAGQGKGQHGPVPQASEIARKVHETLAAKTEPGNPGLQAALAELLGKGKGKGNGLRIAATGTGKVEHQPLINTAMLATTGMDTTNGNGASTFNLFPGTGQQANLTASGAQAAASSQTVAPGAAGIADTSALAGSTKEISGGASGVNTSPGLSGMAGGSETVHPGHSLEVTGTAGPSRAGVSQAASVSHQVSVQISKAIGAGNDRISIQLDPAELGRIDVKLEISGDGRVVARVTADRSETLDMLQRDYRGLERALQQAGLQTDSDSLNFNLRQGGQGEGGTNAGDSGGAEAKETQLAEASEDPKTSANSKTSAANDGRLDIQV